MFRPGSRAALVLAVLGLLLLAVNLRTALAAFSSVADWVDQEIQVTTETAGLIGAAPSACFAVFGLFTPRIARLAGLERSAIIALVAVLVGHVIRSVAAGPTGLVVGTVVIFAGAGIGNVLVPALIKRYFHDHVNVMTGVVGFLYAVATGVTAIATPMAAGLIGWRWALGLWGAFAIAAAVPWILLAAGSGRQANQRVFLETTRSTSTFPSVWRSSLAWALMLTFGYGAIASYSLFAWLPSILGDLAGVPAAEAGGYLAIFGFMGIPINVILIMVGIRRRAQGVLLVFGILCFMVGYAGLAILPVGGYAILWVGLIGLGPFAMQMVLVLLALRTRSPQATVALSGFVQSVGYGIGAAGPLLLGIGKDAAGGWTLPLLVLALGALPLLFLARTVLRSGQFDAQRAGDE